MGLGYDWTRAWNIEIWEGNNGEVSLDKREILIFQRIESVFAKENVETFYQHFLRHVFVYCVVSER